MGNNRITKHRISLEEVATNGRDFGRHPRTSRGPFGLLVLSTSEEQPVVLKGRGKRKKLTRHVQKPSLLEHRRSSPHRRKRGKYAIKERDRRGDPGMSPIVSNEKTGKLREEGGKGDKKGKCVFGKFNTYMEEGRREGV